MKEGKQMKKLLKILLKIGIILLFHMIVIGMLFYGFMSATTLN